MIYKKYLKRIIDICVALIIGIIFFPIFSIVAILIKIDSKGPVIFKHKRLGKSCVPIYVWKFRTMINNAMDIGPEYTCVNDRRITNIGRILRKTSIDELPQIINILIGNMSLVGPRPDVYVDDPSDYQKENTSSARNNWIGTNKWSQFDNKKKREEYDLYYIDNYDFILDLKIILKTIKIVLKQDGIN